MGGKTFKTDKLTMESLMMQCVTETTRYRVGDEAAGLGLVLTR